MLTIPRAGSPLTRPRRLLLVAASVLLGWLWNASAIAQVANNDSYVTDEDQSLSTDARTGVRANDIGFILAEVEWGMPRNGTLTFTLPDGSFIYVPNANFNGIDTFVYRLRDPFGNVSNEATVTIAVNAVNDAPLGVVNRAYNTAQGTPLRVDAPGVLAGVTDVELNVVSAQLVTTVAPAAGTLSVGADGAFTFSPAVGFSGTATFSYRAVDNGAPPAQTDPANVTITVTDVNDPPVANPDSYAATEDTLLTVAAPGVLGNDTDPDQGARLTAVIATSVPATAGTLTVNADGSFTFQPAVNFSGVTSFTYSARDEAAPPGQSAAATVTIGVAAVNDAPVAGPDNYETNENVSLVVAAAGVLANDTDAENGALTAELVTPVAPSSGTLSLSPNGSFSYNPSAGFSGTATFTYRAVDNELPRLQSVAAATVTITVRNVNDPPVAAADVFTATEDTPLNVAAAGVLGNDSDPDAATVLTALVVAPPVNGTLTLNANGSFVYAPAADYNGPDTFTYRARDNGTPPLYSNVVSVTVNVVSANDAPRFAPGVTALPSQTATENVPFALALAPFFADPEGSPLTFTLAGLPAGLLLATPAGVIGGAPTLNVAAGPSTINVAVSDGQSQFTAPFTLLVLAAGRTDLAVSATATPSPALINQPVTWTFAVDNRSPVESVGNLTLQVVFSGPPSFVVTPGPRCTAAPRTGGTTLTCAAGPVPPSAGIAVTAVGSSSQPGDIVAAASVAITDNVPVDATPENDDATMVVNIAQSLAAGPAQTLSGVGYRASASGDFDGDGFIDLAIATEGGAGTVIYPNVVDASTPGGTKRTLAAQPIPLGDAGASTGIAVADLDGDRAVDLVIAKASGPSVVLRNLNDRTFGFVAVPTPLGAAGDITHSVAVGDVDGDGRGDLVFGNTGPNRVFTHQGNWTFTQVGALGNDDSRDAAVVELAGDSTPEIVFANVNRGATVYTFDTGTRLYRETLLASGQATSVAAADFDGNGHVDLVFGRAQSKVVLFNTTSPGAALQFSAPVELGASPTADVVATDTDADGDVDIVGINASGSHQVFVNNGVGQFTLRAEQFASAGARHATAAKLSLDDRVDVAVVGASGLEVFYNDGAGNFGRGDTGAPTIRLRGEASIALTVESPYSDPGATAADAVDGDLTVKIKVANPVNPAVIGTHTVTYNVVDSSGNAAAPVTRTVTVTTRQGTGGGGGGAFDLVVLLLLSALALLRNLRAKASSGYH